MPSSAKQKQDELQDIAIDMTPMIDMIFNLLIFFMLVTQMVTIERAELELPIAEKAEEIRQADNKILVINVHKDGRVEISGQMYDWAKLRELLIREARESTGSDGTVNRAIVIRGDIHTQYSNIQRVMVECASQKIYRLSFAAKMDAK